MADIVFVCGGKDFHAMDKYLITKKAVYPRRVLLLTDSIDGEAQDFLTSAKAEVHRLVIIDKFLFKKSSSIANFWRNLVKLLLLPLQVYYLRKFFKKHSDCIFHAIPIYYMMLCYLARVPFVGTPQGSEILVRPSRSSLYKRYAIKSLKAAKSVIVDSVNMQKKVFELSGVQPIILKNGFDTDMILKLGDNFKRRKIISIRGFNPIYRIEEILKGRENSIKKPQISFVYPAAELDYKDLVLQKFYTDDLDLGKLDKKSLYEMLHIALLVISIPESDSSPRSVYESIFSGACVAVTYSPYLDELPVSMRQRVYLVNLEDNDWFDKAIEFAEKITKRPFLPCEEALEMCNQDRTINKILKQIY